MKKITLFIIALFACFSSFSQNEATYVSNGAGFNQSPSTYIKWDWAQIWIEQSESLTGHGFIFLPLPSDIDTASIDSACLNINYSTVDATHDSVEIEFYYRENYSATPRWSDVGYPENCVSLGKLMLTTSADYRFANEKFLAYAKSRCMGEMSSPIFVRCAGADYYKIGLKGKSDGANFSSATLYGDIATNVFLVDEVLPTEQTSLPAMSPLTVVCNVDIDSTSTFPKVYIDKTEEAVGTWVLSPANTLTFTPSEAWPANTMITVEIQDGLRSTDSLDVDLSDGYIYRFIGDTDVDYGEVVEIYIDTMALVDHPQVDHVLPLKIAIPTNSSQKLPVHIWVHGGGWSGGNDSTSNASISPHYDYLAENLGIATLSIAYRCTGSNGNFTLAMEDIEAVFDWAEKNAEEYNFDMTKVFLSGGSAGTPLSSLAAQRHSTVIGYIGFNGKYDFVIDDGSWGQGTWFGQDDPSLTLNSSIYNLRSTPPATILMHGDEDSTIPYQQSTAFADAINAAGGEAEAVIYPGEEHSFFNVGKNAYEGVLIEMVNFMRKVLEASENTAIDDISSNNAAIAYPNPVRIGEDLSIRLSENITPTQVRVQIFSLLGQEIQNESIEITSTSKTFTINTSQLKQGNYILQVSNNQTSESQKLAVY